MICCKIRLHDGRRINNGRCVFYTFYWQLNTMEIIVFLSLYVYHLCDSTMQLWPRTRFKRITPLWTDYNTLHSARGKYNNCPSEKKNSSTVNSKTVFFFCTGQYQLRVFDNIPNKRNKPITAKVGSYRARRRYTFFPPINFLSKF